MNMKSESNGDLFGAYYYAHNCGAPYSREERWLEFFDQIARRLINDFHPQTVLDAGCAWGLLVERLRARGVEAYGVDISEYAIQHVHPDIQKYCRVGSITDPLPQRYDLIVSIEVFEHMPPADSEQAIANLCQYSDNIVMSSSPVDYKEATHLNVQPPDYWARQFVRHKFIRDLDYDVSTYLPHWAVRFYRPQMDPLQLAVQAYERKLIKIQTEVKELRTAVLEYHQQLEASQPGVQRTGEQRLDLDNMSSAQPEAEGQIRDTNAAEMHRQLVSCQKQLRASEERWRDLEQGRGWKLFRSIQSLRVSLFPVGSRREKILDGLFRRKVK